MTVFNADTSDEPIVTNEVADTNNLEQRLVAKDAFIEQLKREAAEAKEDAQRALHEAELVKLRAEVEAARVSQPQVVQPTNTDATPAFTDEDLVARIKQVTKGLSEEGQRQANEQAVSDALIQHLGDQTKAAEFLSNKAKEMGVSVKFLQSIAASSPAAFFNTAGLSDVAPKSSASASNGSVNTQALNSNNPAPKEHTEAWYQDLRRRDPKTYHSASVQIQRHKDALRQGEAFFT